MLEDQKENLKSVLSLQPIRDNLSSQVNENVKLGRQIFLI